MEILRMIFPLCSKKGLMLFSPSAVSVGVVEINFNPSLKAFRLSDFFSVASMRGVSCAFVFSTSNKSRTSNVEEYFKLLHAEGGH